MGQPLLVWSIRAALLTEGIDRVIVSTDDKEAANIADGYNVEVFWRPSSLATDTSSIFDVLKYVYFEQCKERDIEPEFLVLLQPTSPLREKGLISDGLDLIKSQPSIDRVIELNSKKLFSGQIDSGYWVPDYPEGARSQDLKDIYFPSGRLYIYRCDTTIAADAPAGDKTVPILGNYATNINIDYEDDFDKLEYIFTKHMEKYQHLLK